MKYLDDRDWIYIRQRLDSSLFNLQRLQAHMMNLEQFADDAVFVAHAERLLSITNCFIETAQH